MAETLQQVPDIEGLLPQLYEQGPVEGMRELRRLGLVTATRGLEHPALPPSLEFAAWALLEKDPQAPPQALDSLPFYSLCRGLYLPLLGWDPRRERETFGTETGFVAQREERIAWLRGLMERELGLDCEEKAMYLLADPFREKAPPLSEESILGIIASGSGITLSEARRQLVRCGGPPMLAAHLKKDERSQNPLTAREVILCLSELRRVPVRRRRHIVAHLWERCGRLEAFCLVGLLMGKLHLAWSQRSGALLEILAERWQVHVEEIETASGLRDLFSLIRMVEQKGPQALREVVLQPLIPFRPALAQSLNEAVRYPAWAECKYDGIRMLLHKGSDSSGRVQGAAYTRKRHDWSELILGLPQLLQALPARSLILDGELHGTILSEQGVPRPATVYEVHQRVRGEGVVQLRYVALDVLYWEGQDLTQTPFLQRRQLLERLLQPLQSVPLALPIALSSGGRIDNEEQLNRFYQQYRRQGHEGVMIKTLDAGYAINTRTPAWLKKKPELTLELALTGAFWGEKQAPGGRVFDSYTVSAWHGEKLEVVGTVAGVDQAQTQQLVWEIQRQQLLTGRSLQYRGNDRVATGVELTPFIVVSVSFEGVLKDFASGEVSLRGPRIKAIRSGELSVREVTRWEELERLALRDRLA